MVAAAVAVALLSALSPGAWTPAQGREGLEVTTSAVRGARAGEWRLTLEMQVPEGLHVYARSGPGFDAATVRFTTPGMTLLKARWPEPADLLFDLSTPVKVFDGKVSATFDVRLPAAAVSRGRLLRVDGVLRYQSCTETACFRPREQGVRWTLR